MHITLNRAAPSLLAGPLLATLLVTSVAHSASRDEDEPIRINARSVEADDRTGAVIYSGNVVVEQGRLSIRADRVEIKTRKGKTELVHATGKPVKLRQRAEGGSGEIQAEADRIDYHVPVRKVDLVGHVTLRRGDDLFTAETLHYDLNSKNLSAAGNDTGDGRVHAVIQPKKPGAEPAAGP